MRQTSLPSPVLGSSLLFLLFILSFLIYGSWAALSQSDVQSLMGDTLTGGSEDVGDFTVTVVLNDTDALFVLEGSGSVGWLAVGVGSTMMNSDIYVAWPGSGSSWVVSHRSCTDYMMPEEVKGGSADLVLVESLSSSSTVAFTRPLDLSTAKMTAESDFGFIYAACKTKPDGTDTDAEIEEHDNGAYGRKTVDLSAKYGSSSGGSNSGDSDDDDSGGASSSSSSPSPTASKDEGSNQKDDKTDTSSSPSTTDDSKTSNSTQSESSSSSSGDSTETITSDGPDVDPKTVFLVHAILAIIAWVFLSPIAIVFGRYRPYKNEASAIKKPLLYWLDMHERLQYTTLTLTIVVVALGVYGINAKGMPHFKRTHQLYGVIFLCLVVCQVALGWTVHALGGGGDDKRPWKRWLHIILGLTLTSTGLWQCWTGWDLLVYAQLDWPGVARTALGVVAALLCAAYAAKVVQTFIKRSQLISAYNARARQWRLPTSQESNISRTRTDKLQRDVDDLQEKAQSFSQRPTGGAGATGVGPSRSMRSLGSVDKQRYDPGSNAPSGYSGSGAAALPFSVAHQPHYGSPAQYNMMPRFG